MVVTESAFEPGGLAILIHFLARRSRASAALVIVCCLLQGCGGSRGTLFEPIRAPKARFHVDLAQVFVVEQSRQASTSRKFDTPTFSLPGQGEARQLLVGSGLLDRLQIRLSQLLVNQASGALEFEIHVLRADAGWRASWTAETAFTNVALRICVFDGDDHSLLTVGHAEGWAEVQRADVADGQPSALFDTTVFSAWEKWLSDDTITLIDARFAMKNRVLVSFPGCTGTGRAMHASNTPSLRMASRLRPR